ncbi:MAG TPA: metalloregulator ArsR/SmtB family transcription factor [Actinomycetota bacterium]|nr:metalloregulator ArsR/SmtB family transcription factor [Actinomycetota bacterium]
MAAIANPVRRRMLELVWDAERTPSDLAERLGLTRPATSQHLRVLRDAGLVEARVEGGHRYYAVREEQLQALREFLEGFWGSRLGRLRTAAEQHQRRSRGDS